MNKFRIARDKEFPLIIDLLVQLLSNQHAFITAALVEFAEKNNLDAGDLAKRLEKSKAEYDADFREWVLENYGNLDVDDLIE